MEHAMSDEVDLLCHEQDVFNNILSTPENQHQDGQEYYQHHDGQDYYQHQDGQDYYQRQDGQEYYQYQEIDVISTGVSDWF